MTGRDKSYKTYSLVIDSCIWIDLANGIILEEMFQLPHKIIDPDILIQEEVRPTNWQKLTNLGVSFISASAGEVAEVVRLNAAYRGLSFYDASVLELAMRLNYILLTDDNRLKKAARDNAVHSEGILWLLNEMVTCGCITGTEAIVAMERIHHSGHAIREAERLNWKKQWSD